MHKDFDNMSIEEMEEELKRLMDENKDSIPPGSLDPEIEDLEIEDLEDEDTDDEEDDE